MPTTSWPCSLRSIAATLESTPPLNPTAIFMCVVYRGPEVVSIGKKALELVLGREHEAVADTEVFGVAVAVVPVLVAGHGIGRDERQALVHEPRDVSVPVVVVADAAAGVHALLVPDADGDVLRRKDVDVREADRVVVVVSDYAVHDLVRRQQAGGHENGNRRLLDQLRRDDIGVESVVLESERF